MIICGFWAKKIKKNQPFHIKYNYNLYKHDNVSICFVSRDIFEA